MSEEIFDKTIELADNAMLKHNPERINEWNFERNTNFNIYDITYQSSKKVWWKCNEGHEWEALVKNRRNQKSVCPICKTGYSRTVSIGINDMWTTNPVMASYLLNSENGYKYTQGSGVRLDWKCLDCGEIVKNKKISVVYRKGISCPVCQDGIPFGEKFIYYLLKESDIDFEFDIAQKWSQRKRYDFHLYDQNTIIEAHGEQHYLESRRGRTLQEEQENDALKEKLARENGIDKYIVIDTRENTLKWIKNDIDNSELANIIKHDIDYIKIEGLARRTFIKEASRIWNEDTSATALEISRRMKLNRYTILRYLIRGNEIGWCNYTREEDARRNGNKPTQNKKHKVVQLTKDGEFVAEWESMTEASKNTRATFQNISSVCKGRVKTAGGYRWMYKDDYDKIKGSQ